MSSATWAVIPIKPLRESKSRLRPVLSIEERAQLALAMLELVVAAVRNAAGLAGWAVVSRDEKIRSRVESLGGAYVQEQGRGLDRALEQAGQWCVARGADAMLVLHADLPALQTWEVEFMLKEGDGRARVVLAPSLDGTGTNAMLVRPPDLLRFSFGSGSLARHLGAARALGLAPRLYRSPGIAGDVDTPSDLLRWRAGAATTTEQASEGLVSRPSSVRKHAERGSTSERMATNHAPMIASKDRRRWTR